MRRVAMAVLAVTAVALLLSGCGDFRQQAQEMADRMEEAAQRAEVAEAAAAQNAAQLLAVKDRLEVLEAEIAELRDRLSEVLAAPDETESSNG